MKEGSWQSSSWFWVKQSCNFDILGGSGSEKADSPQDLVEDLRDSSGLIEDPPDRDR